MKTSPSICSASLALLLAAPFLTKAATVTWVGGGSDFNWATSGNWSNAAGPIAGGTSDLIFLSGSVTTSTNNLAGLTASSITFANGSSDNHLAGSNTLTIAGNVIDNTGSWQSIDLPVALLGTIPFQINNGQLTMNGAMSDGASAGGVNKSGGNWLYLTGTNTYSGGTTVSAGLVQFSKTASLPASGSVSATGNGILAIKAGGTGEFTNATSGAGTIGGFLGSASFAAGTSFGIDTGSGNLTYSGTVSGVQGLMKLGNNTLTLTGSNMTYTGATTINAGSLQLDVASGSTNFTSAIGGGGSLIKNSSGTLILSGSSTFTGGLTVNTSGTIQLANASAMGNTGSLISISPGSGTVIDLATDTSVKAYAVSMGSGKTATILVDRATAGAGINHSLGAFGLGASTMTFSKGPNVTSGTASVSISSLDLSGGERRSARYLEW